VGRVTYVEFDGTQRVVELADETSLMQGALANGVRGIDGDCGGCCACATCHVHVDPAWSGIVGPSSEIESELLQLSADVASDSRLACQIKMSPDLDGVVVHVPQFQQ